mgnify:FL=1
MENSRQIYVACLASYNAGILHGRWVDLSYGPDAEDVWAEINEMLDASPEPGAEEFAIHDSQNLGVVREYESIKDLTERAAFISEAEDKTGDAYLGAGLLDNFHGNLNEARRTLETYSGCFNDAYEYGYYYAESFGDAGPSKFLEGYIDYKKLGEDLFVNSICIKKAEPTAWQKIHVFDNI